MVSIISSNSLFNRFRVKNASGLIITCAGDASSIWYTPLIYQNWSTYDLCMLMTGVKKRAYTSEWRLCTTGIKTHSNKSMFICRSYCHASSKSRWNSADLFIVSDNTFHSYWHTPHQPSPHINKHRMIVHQRTDLFNRHLPELLVRHRNDHRIHRLVYIVWTQQL